jgi:hypothetical protein
MLAARLMRGVPAASLHYVAGVAPVGVPAFAAAMALGALVRRLGARPPPPELRLSLPESEGGGRAVARPPPQSGELRYIAWAAA